MPGFTQSDAPVARWRMRVVVLANADSATSPTTRRAFAYVTAYSLCFFVCLSYYNAHLVGAVAVLGVCI